MIRPNMAMTYDDACRVRDLKGPWVVEYLRARRTGGRLALYFRREHFKSKKGQKNG